MMSKSRILTPCWLAICSTLVSGLVLKPTMMALPAAAVSTSDSVMTPTPESRIFTPTLRGGELLQRLRDRLGGALHVGLDDDVELLGWPPVLALANRSSSVARLTLPSSFARAFSARCSATSLAAFSSCDHVELVAGGGHAGEAEHLDRVAGPDLLHLLAALVHHGADAAVVDCR